MRAGRIARSISFRTSLLLAAVTLTQVVATLSLPGRPVSGVLPAQAQPLPSNPGVAPGTGTGSNGRAIAPGPAGRFGSPGVEPYQRKEPRETREEVSRDSLLRENWLARQHAAQMQRRAEAFERYFRERDPIEAKEYERAAWRWKERLERLERRRENLLQSE